MSCPVCRSRRSTTYSTVGALDYRRCDRCVAIYLPPEHLPRAEAEAAYYQLHRNEIDDPGYRAFLGTFATPLLERLSGPRSGLDFGCGPGPALAHMLREAGHEVALYDPLFFPDERVLAQQYDFIACTEVLEHLHRPAQTIGRLFDLLHPGGLLAVMTGFPPDADRFAAWHYRRDPTHVVFYQPETFAWLADRHRAHCEIPCTNVALLTRHAEPR